MSCVLGGVIPLGLLFLVCGSQGYLLPNVTLLEELLSKYQHNESHSRVRRAIPREDKEEILMLHNKLRGQVQPQASNMEYMVSAGSGRRGWHRGWGLGHQPALFPSQLCSPASACDGWLRVSSGRGGSRLCSVLFVCFETGSHSATDAGVQWHNRHALKP
uniref:Isoform 4 of Cysteine-rich secretory protein LCCL domain-containing 2 n=1 Tax=Homo sapiens TaxID=9606 RepID=Q9H0B8-4|nr:trypsin inhibitor [Homo sapiens]